MIKKIFLSALCIFNLVAKHEHYHRNKGESKIVKGVKCSLAAIVCAACGINTCEIISKESDRSFTGLFQNIKSSPQKCSFAFASAAANAYLALMCGRYVIDTVGDILEIE